MYTTTRSSLGAENNVDLVLNVEDFDVETRFERCELAHMLMLASPQTESSRCRFVI